MPSPYSPYTVDLTAFVNAAGGSAWPASLAEAQKLPPEKLTAAVSNAIKVPTVKAYLAECQKAADLMKEKIEYDKLLDLACANLAIVVAFFTSLQGQNGIAQKVDAAKMDVLNTIAKLPAVIKANWQTVKPNVVVRNGTQLDCALYGWHSDGPIQIPAKNPPLLYKLDPQDGKVYYQGENAKYYSELPKMVKGNIAAWPQLLEWVTTSDENARKMLSALYLGKGELSSAVRVTKALYPAVAKFLQTEVEPKLVALLLAWRYGSPQELANKKQEKAIFEKQIEGWTAKRKELADSYAVILKQLPTNLLAVPAGFLRDVAYQYGAALIAAAEAQAHASAAAELADRAAGTLDQSGRSVQDAKSAQSKVTAARSGVDFGESEQSSSAANRAGAAYAGADAAAKRAGANVRNGKAASENEAARQLGDQAKSTFTALGLVPQFPAVDLTNLINSTSGQIEKNAENVIDQGADLLEIFSKLPELDLSNLSAQVEHNTETAEQQLKKTGLPWWVIALAGLAYLRR
jgi:hypothetical protein